MCQSAPVDEENLLRNEYLVAENRVLAPSAPGSLARRFQKHKRTQAFRRAGAVSIVIDRGASPRSWGSEAMSAIRVPRHERAGKTLFQQRDAMALPGGDLDPGLYLRVHAGIRHLWHSPTQASQLTSLHSNAA